MRLPWFTLLTIMLIAGCGQTAPDGPTADSSSAQGAVPVAATQDEPSGTDLCPLLGAPTLMRYEIRTGTERQYRVHLVNTSDLGLEERCHGQLPLPGNVVMRYRIGTRA